MIDYIRIEPHRPPWAPTSDSALVATYRVEDVPTIGRLQQDGRDYLFWMLDSGMGASSWGFARVNEAELGRIASAEDVERVLGEVTTGKPVVVAAYRQGQGILAWEVRHQLA
jgi:hypothetical protein